MIKMKCNIDPIMNATKPLDASTNALSSSLSGDWDDEVKESYRKYIFQCKDVAEKITSAEARMKAECERLSSIDVDGLIASAEATCIAIDGV